MKGAGSKSQAHARLACDSDVDAESFCEIKGEFSFETIFWINCMLERLRRTMMCEKRDQRGISICWKTYFIHGRRWFQAHVGEMK